MSEAGSSKSLMRFFKLGSLTNDKVINVKSVNLDSDDLKKLFFNGWKTNQTKVSLELIFRGMNKLAGISHWAWILKSDGLKEDNFFCSIEYGDKGIVISTYEEFDGIENVCRGCMGDSDKVFYKTFTTSHNLGEILLVVDEKKEKYNQESYNAVTLNCRNFAISMGKFLINKTLTINDSNYYDGYRNISITKPISLNNNEIKDMFGSSWERSPSNISLELVQSNKDSKNLAWILKAKNDLFWSIKYDEEGIVINQYDKTEGIESACRYCFPGSNNVSYNEYSTKKQLKDILLKLDQMKAIWKGTHILVDMEKNQFIENDEPMRFVLELGEFFLGKKLTLGSKFEKTRPIDI
jgi:hypothetical protein